jgi:hypothetical protein
MTLELGYNPSQNNPLSTKDWAWLACSVVAATGRGFHRTSLSAPDSSLEKMRAETLDVNPIDLQYPSLFHCLAAMADHLEHSVSTDLDDYQTWYYNICQKTEKSLARLATSDLEEKWREWKADQIDHQAATHEAEIATAVRNCNSAYFMSAAMSLGLNIVFEGPFDTPCPMTGQKRTVSGLTPTPAPSTPMPTRTNPPRMARQPSPFATP